MHFYASVGSLLETGDAEFSPPEAVEFFDATGRRLAPVFSKTWKLIDLRRTGDRSSDAMICRRLSEVAQHLRDTVDQRLTMSGNTIVTREQALACIPDLRGLKLQQCFTVLSAVFGHAQGEEEQTLDDGSFWHNLFNHCC
jgi:hypothetical protein